VTHANAIKGARMEGGGLVSSSIKIDFRAHYALLQLLDV
jgi:hypothetical protein